MRIVRPFSRKAWMNLSGVLASLVWAFPSYCQCETLNAGCIGGKIEVRSDPKKCGAPKSDTLDDDAPNTVWVTVRGSGKTKRFLFDSGRYEFAALEDRKSTRLNSSHLG